MAQYSDIKPRGYDKTSNPGVGKANLQPVPLLAIVKDNVDPNRTGRIQAYILDNSGADENDSSNWRILQYMSPFFGRTDPQGADASYGEFKLNPSAYGMWFSPPEIGSTVVCIFINGDMSPQNSFYIGCVPDPVAMRMVPAIGANFDQENVVFNEGEAEKLGGAIRVPVTNLNANDAAAADSPEFITKPKPCHSYSAAVMFQQGIIRDPIRGPISSSSQRESPSRVGWGVSTPGRPIYDGGYDDKTLPKNVTNATPEQLKVISRRGGHFIVMDDGDIFGRDQLVKIRTALGHQILMSDDGQVLMILHSNGQSYIELGKEGTVDVYSTNSINLRTQGDLNLHADNNVNIHATKDLKIQAQNIQINSETNYNLRVGADYQTSALGKHTTRSNGPLAMLTSGEASMVAGGISYVNGSKVNLNTGKPSTTPAEVTAITVVAHTDTLFDKQKGYLAAPSALKSITSRAPAHAPWAHACQGVDVNTNLDADANLPPAPTGGVSSANQAASSPAFPVEQGTISAMPNAAGAVSSALDTSTTSAMLGVAATATATTAQDAIKQGSAILTDAAGKAQAVVGQFGQTAQQLENSGILKTGAAALVNSLVEGGSSVAQAMTDNLFTGMPGASNFTQLVNNVPAQASSYVTNLRQAQSALTFAGAITGKEAGTQIAGVVMSAATQGVGSTLSALSTISGGAGGNLFAGGAGLDALRSGPFAWISSGNFGAGLAALNSGLGGIGQSIQSMVKGLGVNDIIAQTKGAVAAAFGAIAASFKAFKPRVPQNLKQIAKESAAETAQSAASKVGDNSNGLLNSIAGAASSTVGAVGDVLAAGAGTITGVAGTVLNNTLGTSTGSQLSNVANNLAQDATNAINNPLGAVNSFVGGIADAGTSLLSSLSNPAASLASGIDKLPGGQGSIAQVIDRAAGTITSSVPGLDKISGLISEAQTAAMNGLPGVDSIINQATNGLTSFASTGLPAGAASQLQAAISSIGGGSGEVKLATVAVNTCSRESLETATAEVISDEKVPKPDLSGNPPSAEEVASLQDKFDQAYADYRKARNEYYDYYANIYKPHLEERDELLKTTERGDPRRAAWNERHPSIRAELLRLAEIAKNKLNAIPNVS